MKKKLIVTTLSLVTSLGFAQIKEKEQSGNADIITPAAQEPKDGIYNAAGLQKQPEYPGGILAFFEYFQANFNYKNLTTEYDNTKTLRVYVQFIVEKDGTITNIKLLRDPGYGSGSEVVRVLKADKTKWKPGIQNGQPVRASYNLPITINAEKATADNVKVVTNSSAGVEVPNSKDPIYNSAGLQAVPKYPGDISKFIDDIKAAINVKNLVAGYDKQVLRTFASFVVETDGSLSNVKILRDPGFGVGKEIERVIKANKTKWLPGIQNDKPVRASFNLPVVLGSESSENKNIVPNTGSDNHKPSGDLDLGSSAKTEPAEDNKVYTTDNLQVLPEFPGGNDAFIKAVNNRINMSNLEAGATGKKLSATISLIIEKNGMISSVQLLKDSGFGAGKEIQRVIPEITSKWSPGIQHGKPVKVRLPLQITIEPKK